MLVLKRIICILISLFDLMSVAQGKPVKYMDSLHPTITIHENVEYQDFNGFGSSACWWAQDAGNSEYADEIAKSLYSKEGLALNIYRYNIGGGEKDNPNSRIRGNRATESFYYYNETTGEYEYDFTRDAGAQAMLDKCLSYGCIDTVVLFANSPHYSMTVSGQATGGLEPAQSNLPPENYEAYADYFLTITDYFLEKGVPVKYISPINEPQWDWGGGWVGQEGCHYEMDEVVALLKVFAVKMAERGTPVKLMGPECGETAPVTEEYFDKILADEDITKVLGSLSYHSYWADVSAVRKTNFGKAVNEKYKDYNVDMTEWCELPCQHSIDDFYSAVIMARVIAQDLSLSNANSWTSWVAVNNYGINEEGKMVSDGLLVADDACTELYTAQRYNAMAHFSKFIPAGSKRIKLTSDVYDFNAIKYDDGTYADYSTISLNMVGFKTPEGKTVVVLVNEGKTRNVIFDKLFGHMTVYQSTYSEQMKLVHDGLVNPVIKVPGHSITTVIFG